MLTEQEAEERRPGGRRGDARLDVPGRGRPRLCSPRCWERADAHAEQQTLREERGPPKCQGDGGSTQAAGGTGGEGGARKRHICRNAEGGKKEKMPLDLVPGGS